MLQSSSLFSLCSHSIRKYSYRPGCPPPKPPCPTCCPGGGKKQPPAPACRAAPIPANPCVPRYYHGKDKYKRFKYIFFLISLPIILIKSFISLSHEPPHKGECRDYEYMRRRTKRFPWGEGIKSYFHNDHVNHLPGECEEDMEECE